MQQQRLVLLGDQQRTLQVRETCLGLGTSQRGLISKLLEVTLESWEKG